MLRSEPDRTSRFVRLRQSESRGRTREADGRSRATGLPRGEVDAVPLQHTPAPVQHAPPPS